MFMDPPQQVYSQQSSMAAQHTVAPRMQNFVAPQYASSPGTQTQGVQEIKQREYRPLSTTASAPVGRDISMTNVQAVPEIQQPVYRELPTMLDEPVSRLISVPKQILRPGNEGIQRPALVMQALEPRDAGPPTTLYTIERVRSKEISMGDEFLGRGTSAEVTKGTFRGLDVAVKSFLGGIEPDAVDRELEAMQKINGHPNIVRCLCACISPPRLVMELLPHGSLRALLCNPLHGLDEASKAALLACIASGLSFIHGQDPWLVHCDVKPANVLLARDAQNHICAKLADFGLAVLSDTIRRTTSQANGGTIAYKAPELFAKKGQKPSKPKPPSDMYAFGVVVAETWTEQSPWSGYDNDDIRAMMKEGDRSGITRPSRWSAADVLRLVDGCLDQEAGQRFTAKEASEALRGRAGMS